MSTDSSRRIAFLVSGKCEQNRSGPRRDVENLAPLLLDDEIGQCKCETVYDCADEAAYLAKLKTVTENWNPNDQLILYYAGHGKTDRRLNKWCLVFGEQQESRLIFGWVLDILEMHGVTRAIVILDACYAGEALNLSRSNESELFKDLPTGMAFIVSAGRLQKAYDKPDQSGGVFTTALCEALETGLRGQPSYDGVIGVEDFFNYVHNHADEHQLKQQPHFSIQNADKSIWIARNKSGGERPVASDQLSAGRVRSSEEWEHIARSTDDLDKPCESASLDDLDWDLIQEFVKSTRAPWNDSDSRSEKATKLRLLASLPSANETPLRKNSVLCFGLAPHEFLEGAECRIFYGDVADSELISDTIAGPISRQIIEATERVLRHMKGRASFRSGPRRVQTSEIPEEVIRELLSNALIHRDYESPSSVDIRFTTNELVVTSPGLFADSPNWKDYLEHDLQSNPRNPKLVRFMRALGVFEKYGRGFQVFKKFIAENGPSSISFASIPGPATRITVTRPEIRYSDEARKHVFISYNRDNLKDVVRLRDDLVAAGESVWWDQDILPGQDWKNEIRAAMRDAYAVIVCLSSAVNERDQSHIYAEIRDAIAAYREDSSSSVFLIPIRLDECEIPSMAIDATRTLDRLQYIDLFPAETRAEGIRRVLQAIHNTPFHPKDHSDDSATKAAGLQRTDRAVSNYFVHSLLRARDWQHRPQLDDVCDWWRNGGRGVCALIGMGGAGKTAVVERFLRRLPSGLPVDPQVEKDSSLPQPNGIFIFSFYDAPNADAFFESLQMWLEGAPRVDTVLSLGQMAFLLQQHQGLIVIDGLERVQHDGQRGDFGRLVSPKLRDFLNQLAGGNFSDLSVLVTSRFPLADLRDKNPRFFHLIPVNQIDIAAGVQLLRDRGVRGTDLQLEPIVEKCGRHALTVDFAGGYIAEYGHGDPSTPLDLGTAEGLRLDSEREELDEDQREVLRQGHRFARIAEHYRDAMLQRDEAAMALLERICLFRLGVDSETLGAIFTGKLAIEVSGEALAALNVEQLQNKLDWLVRMRIVEATEFEISGKGAGKRYSIHPAVRDGFLSGISRDAAVAGHEAVRRGLEVSLGEAPGENPSDPATLDLLEEIVHHTLQSGHVRKAWDIYRNRIAGFENLGWRLGAYERGERICRAFAGGQASESMAGWLHQPQAANPRLPTDGAAQETNADTLRRMPFLDLPEAAQAIFINEWALYLSDLGRLAAAARCYEIVTEMKMRQEDWRNASASNRNLCDVWLLSGRLRRFQEDECGRRTDETDASLPPSSFGVAASEESPATSARQGASSAGALATADEALRLAELADDAEMRRFSHAYRGHTRALLGEVPTALTDFRAALNWTDKSDAPDGPLYGTRGIQHTHLLVRLGRHEEATRLTEAHRKIIIEHFDTSVVELPKCQLLLASLSVECSGASADLWTQARDWAQARDAKEVLCWSFLVEAQHSLANYKNEIQASEAESSGDPEASSLALRACSVAIESGLKIARDCGYGLYHIDLLLVRARLHILQGDASAALDDVEMALGDDSGGGGIPANEATGQPELLAAKHENCSYAWAIPVGLQLRAEAMLLRTAQTLGRTETHATEDESSSDITQMVDRAKGLLHEALDYWHNLRDPSPNEENNFQLNDREFNYRAAETHSILDALDAGILVRQPLTPIVPRESTLQSGRDLEAPPWSDEIEAAKRFDVALSFPGEQRDFVEGVANALTKTLSRERIFYDRFYEAELARPNLDTHLRKVFVDEAELMVVFECDDYREKEWCGLEWRAIRDIVKKRQDQHVMIVRDSNCAVDGIFAHEMYLDSSGLTASDIAKSILSRLKVLKDRSHHEQ